MNYKIVLTILILCSIQAVLSDKTDTIRNTKKLAFVRGENNANNEPQLTCVDVKDQPKLCENYPVEIVVCLNTKKSSKLEDFQCDLALKDFKVKFAYTKIRCDILENDTYVVGTCSLKYSLVEEKNWFKRNLGFIIGGIVIAVIAIVIAAAAYSQFGRKKN